MIPKIYTLHGIKNHDTFDAFHNKSAFNLNMIDELHAEAIYYGYVNAIAARFKNKKIAKELYRQIPDGSILVTHSNGCLLAYMLAQMGKKFAGVVMVQPALDRDKYIPKNSSPWVHVYYNPYDWIVSLGSILLFHGFGEMGRYGPKVTPRHYKCFNTTDPDDGMPDAPEHSWFMAEYGDEWLQYIGRNIVNEYSNPTR